MEQGEVPTPDQPNDPAGGRMPAPPPGGPVMPPFGRAVAHTTRPLRVLHVLEPVTGGVPAYVDCLGQELRAIGVEQTVVVSRTGAGPCRAWATDVRPVTWRRRSLDTFRVAALVRDIAVTGGIDVIHAHATFAGVASRIRPSPVPVVFQPHGWGFLSPAAAIGVTAAALVERLFARRTARILTLSTHEDAHAPAGVQPHRVPPLRDLSAFGPTTDDERHTLRSRFGWADDEAVHLCVGEMSHRKNQTGLVAAWARGARPGHRLVLAGGGGTPPEIPKLAGSVIEVLGHRSDVPDLMRAADSLIVSSRGEGFSLVILEALASGLPVFTTCVGGAEVISPDDGYVGDDLDELVKVATASPLTRASGDERQARADGHVVSTAEAARDVQRIYEDLVPAAARVLGRS